MHILLIFTEKRSVIPYVLLATHFAYYLVRIMKPLYIYIYIYIYIHIYVRKIKPVYYRRYVDDIFAPFRSHDHLEKFTNYLNSKHKILNLPMKKKVTINCLFWIF